ncbi:MAG: protein-L-isoaspartate O-methyltransferase, partial [Candidatus Omnitrophica bacterium]|nr:protein-L-isoaspartate O-methyltransferase [Candidatus Omnitrophota bacterium]
REIGSGSGYQTSILAELAGAVYTIERFPELSLKAQTLLGELGYSNIHYKVADGTLGWKEEAPFDRILLTAYSNRVPQPLLDQLAAGGKLLLPLGEMFSQMLTLVEKREKSYISRDVCPCVFVPLVGRYGVRSA